LNKKEGQIKMNKGLRLLREKDKLEGKIEGRIETYSEFGLTPEQIAEKVNMPVEKIKEILNQSEQMIQI
jgi:predicted transposase YdaD